jgi:hypothetical protein
LPHPRQLLHNVDHFRRSDLVISVYILHPLSGPNEVKDEPFPLEGFLEEKLDVGKIVRVLLATPHSFTR